MSLLVGSDFPQQVTWCRYVGAMTYPTSVQELSDPVTMNGVCSQVCIGGVHASLSGQMGVAWLRIGLSAKYPRHEDDCRSEPVRKHRLCCSRIGRGSGVGFTHSPGCSGIWGKVLVSAESNVHWRRNNDPMSTNPGEERQFGCFYLRLDPVLTHR